MATSAQSQQPSSSLHFTALALFLLLLLATLAAAASETALRINTDLTAGVVGESAARVVSGDIEPSKQNALDQQQQQQQSPSQSLPAPPDMPSNTEQQQQLQQLLLAAHICTREETYVEQLKVPTMQPVRVRTSKWCLEFPPRCSNYKTEMREVLRVENVTKTRTIRFCCAGYEGNISINDTICKPVCRGGCGRGHCQLPDVCSCEVGYTGKHCTQRCDHDHWGMQCKNECQCKNGAVCDNKTGLCHCTTGWAGEFCELPCPRGTYGVMCRKACECEQLHCHPQTGACESASTVDSLPSNVTHSMFETLNSTIANITHNLDRIAQKIVHITPSSSTEPTVGSLELSSSKPLPELIVIKQSEQQTPKIIVHGPHAGLLENLHTASGQTPEVIHVITSWPTNATATHDDNIDLAGFAGISAGHEHKSTPKDNFKSNDVEHETNLLSLLLILLLVIMIAIAASFLYVYRRYHWQRERVEAVLAAHSAPATSAASTTQVGLSECGPAKSYLKPLPDLPAFTQALRNKIEEPAFYDSPSNNSSLKTPCYAYARKESLYSVVTPKSRKGSQESHLYDEIPYPTPLALQAYPDSPFQRSQPPLQRVQHSAYVSHQPPPVPLHVSQLVIPPHTHAKFQLQPAPLTHIARKIAHL